MPLDPDVTIEDTQEVETGSVSADVSILTIRDDIRERMAAGMKVRDIVAELVPVYDAAIPFERFPGSVGIAGEMLDGVVWALIIRIIYAAERARQRRLEHEA